MNQASARERVQTTVARWDNIDPVAVDVRSVVGARGTLVFAAVAGAAGAEDRWFGARAIYVDEVTADMFRIPGYVAFMPAAEDFLSDPAQRAACVIDDDPSGARGVPHREDPA